MAALFSAANEKDLKTTWRKKTSRLLHVLLDKHGSLELSSVFRVKVAHEL